MPRKTKEQLRKCKRDAKGVDRGERLRGVRKGGTPSGAPPKEGGPLTGLDAAEARRGKRALEMAPGNVAVDGIGWGSGDWGEAFMAMASLMMGKEEICKALDMTAKELNEECWKRYNMEADDAIALVRARSRLWTTATVQKLAGQGNKTALQIYVEHVDRLAADERGKELKVVVVSDVGKDDEE